MEMSFRPESYDALTLDGIFPPEMNRSPSVLPGDTAPKWELISSLGFFGFILFCFANLVYLWNTN